MCSDPVDPAFLGKVPGTRDEYPLYYAFSATLKSNFNKYCGLASPSLQASGTLTQQTVTIPAYTEKDANIPNDYSCWYEISGPELTYRNTATINVYLESFTNGKVYIYSGTSRTNVTQIVQNAGSMAKGAPIQIPISDGAVLVFKRNETIAAKV